jgi:gamma-tubulin complex component 3
VLHTLHMLRDEGRHQHSGIPNLPIDRPLSALGLGQLPALSRPAPAAAAPARAAETAAEQRARELRREQHDAAVTAALSYDVPEEALVRDAVFAFQGIDGRFIKFDERLDGYAVVAEVGVPLPVRNIVRRICELGWLYR